MALPRFENGHHGLPDSSKGSQRRSGHHGRDPSSGKRVLHKIGLNPLSSKRSGLVRIVAEGARIGASGFSGLAARARSPERAGLPEKKFAFGFPVTGNLRVQFNFRVPQPAERSAPLPRKGLVIFRSSWELSEKGVHSLNFALASLAVLQLIPRRRVETTRPIPLHLMPTCIRCRQSKSMINIYMTCTITHGFTLVALAAGLHQMPG
jgi:hypothetical protein